ncbi:hypothetical protein SLA2020_170000 [Shorea laevis]
MLAAARILVFASDSIKISWSPMNSATLEAWMLPPVVAVTSGALPRRRIISTAKVNNPRHRLLYVSVLIFFFTNSCLSELCWDV